LQHTSKRPPPFWQYWTACSAGTTYSGEQPSARRFWNDRKLFRSKGFILNTIFFALLLLFPAFLSSTSLRSGPALNQPTPGLIIFQVSRVAAYYLGAIPPPSSQRILWFDWNVTVDRAANGTASIQYSQDNFTWSNLLAFTLFLGVAQGRQHIDVSWARAGSNYLRASFNQSLSSVLNLVVFVNYYTTALLTLLPVFIAIAVALSIYVSWRSKRRQAAPTV